MKNLLYIIFICSLCSKLLACSSGSKGSGESPDPAFAQQQTEQLQEQRVMDNIPMAYAQRGSGEATIIFLHGLGGNHRHWQANLPALSKDFRTIAVDLPGYGASQLETVPGDSLLHFFSDALVAFMDSLSLPQAHICGHSMGGQLAILFSLQHPERVSKLILAAPAGLETFSQQEAESLLQFAEATFPQPQSETQIRAAYAMNFTQLPEAAENLIKERLEMNEDPYFPTYAKVLIGGVKGMLETPVAGRLSEIRQPTLILFGQDDKLIPNRHLHPDLTTEAVVRKGHQEIPHSQLELIPEAGHLLMLERPAAFNRLIKDFLKKTNAYERKLNTKQTN